MKQLVSPNLGQQSEAGWCLFFARSAFGAPAVENSAWEGWINTDFKHTDALPNVSVPVWFQHFGAYGSPAVWKNWGHVAIYVPNRGFLSSPITFMQGQQWFSSIDELVNAMNRMVPNSNTQYVGWSEDISNLRVAKEDDVLTLEQVDRVLKMGLRREPTADELNNVAYQQSAGLLIDTVWSNGGGQMYAERDAALRKITELQVALANEEKKPPKEVVKEIQVIVEKPVEVIKEIPTIDAETQENVKETLKVVKSIKGSLSNFIGWFKTKLWR